MEQQIPWFMIGVVWVINFFISWMNARTVGLMWVETKQVGGWSRFMTWMGAIMSASGFTWCYLVVLLFGSYYAQFSFIEDAKHPLITLKGVNAGFALGYLLIIPGVLFSGLMIWIDSLMQAWRRRDLPSIGVAAWNTYAQAHNTYEAMTGFGDAFATVTSFFSGESSGDGDESEVAGKLGILVIMGLVVCALLGGIVTTWSIVLHYAGTRPLPQKA